MLVEERPPGQWQHEWERGLWQIPADSICCVVPLPEGIVHRDPKPENSLMLTLRSVLQILASGMNSPLSVNGIPPVAEPNLLYLGLFQSHNYVGPLVVLWGFGVLFFLMMVNWSLPFEGDEFRINNVSFLIFIESENLLKKFPILNPSEKCILEEIMKDPWINMDPEKKLKPVI